MLHDLKILVLEDEALLAVDLSTTLEDRGATVAGPCLSIESALANADQVDAAILDVDVRGTPCFSVADRLCANGTPIVFHTGRCNVDELFDRYGKSVVVITKPSRPEQIITGIQSALEMAA